MSKSSKIYLKSYESKLKKIVPAKILQTGDRKKIEAYLKKKADKKFKKHPQLWIASNLGVKLDSLVWTDIPGYKDALDAQGGPNSGRIHNGVLTPEYDPIKYILETISAEQYVAVQSGNGIGKTWLVAMIAMWFLCNYENAIVVTTAPKEDQLKKILWQQPISKFYRKLKPKYDGFIKKELTMNLTISDNDVRYMHGITAGVTKGEAINQRMAGQHAENMLYLVEEAAGVEMSIMNTIVSTCVDVNNKIVCVGNPDSITDTLNRVAILPNWAQIRLDAFDHPNVVLNKSVIPGAATKKSIVDKFYLYNGDETSDEFTTIDEHKDPLFLSRVRGICPEGSIYSLYSSSLLKKLRDSVPKVIEVRKYGKGTDLPNSKGSTEIFWDVEHDYTNRYIVAADVAGDELTGDHHACVVYDRVEQRISAAIYMKGPRSDFAQEILYLCDRYSIKIPHNHNIPEEQRTEKDYYRFKPLLSWETNGVGALNLVPEINDYENKYHYISVDTETQTERDRVGWSTTKKSRPEMIIQLRAYSEVLKYNPENIGSAKLANELLTFQHKGSVGAAGNWRFQAANGYHDDLVMALAQALSIDKIHMDDLPYPNAGTKAAEEAEEKRKQASALDRFAQEFPETFDYSGTKRPQYSKPVLSERNSIFLNG